MTSAVHRFGGKARFAQTKGTLRPLISGGDAIRGQGLRCSPGFNVHTSSGQPAILTAGHCGVTTNDWCADQGNSQHIASTSAANFPGTDYSYDAGVDAPGTVNTGQQITAAGDATVTRSGSTTSVHDGQVTALNYQEGSVSSLIDTTVRAEPGDSGGSLFDGATATFFQPVPAALSAYGLVLP
ncbi:MULTISPECIES: S1 family peptidase [Amycolatopsis]|uniref:S1 family peptidase n=1 Tax=Amycolatopsis TaxID=1813 RepID=UPI001E4B7C90|nr:MULTISPECIES: S1 family peptidase [Amycolatopsis]